MQTYNTASSEALRPRQDSQLERFFAWFFILAGFAAGLYTCSRVYDKLDADSWPVAQAHVQSSSIYHSTGRSGGWCMKLRYQYTVDGKTYVSNRLATSRMTRGGCERDRSVIEARMEHYAAGAPIKIRYRPSDPGMAVVYLDGLDFMDWFLAAICAWLVGGGVYILRRTRGLGGP